LENFNKKIGFISLGCDKNRVDTENIITYLSSYPQFCFVSDANEADVIIVNTCAFLKIARNEAENTIKEMISLKNKHLEKLIVVGCLPMLEKDKFVKEHPDVDGVFVQSEYEKIPQFIFKAYGKELPQIEKKNESRILTTPNHYAYLKIADGCNNRCAYCKIPYIRGNFRSAKKEELLLEAERLCEKGVRELILVAQDCTLYGRDLYSDYGLAELLRDLSKIKKLSWIRVLYCYPEHLSDKIIDEIAENHKVVKYIDMPLQHISNNVLKLMNRRSSKENIIDLVNKLRGKIQGLFIRSTFMVGFPGETKDDVRELTNFLKEYKLENVGFFKYSREEGTPSFDFENQIDEKEKDKRLVEVEKCQEKIARTLNKKRVGEFYKVLVDEKTNGTFYGRPYFSAPDVDFNIQFDSYRSMTKVGNFETVEIKDFADGTYIGEVFFDETYE